MGLADAFGVDIARLYATLSKTITFRRMVTLTGANPARNPVDGSITVQTTALIGATSITLTAPSGNWFLEVGDKFTVAGDTTIYTVTARNTAASGKFTGVAFSPALVKDATAGAVVTMTWANDYAVSAIVSRYDSKMIDGTTITNRDLRCIIYPTPAMPAPGPLDKLIIDGVARAVGMVVPNYVGAGVSVYEVQAKG